MTKELLFGDAARKAVHSGISKSAQAVKITLGPRGRNVMLAREYGGPRITNDGVSIAKEISFKDKYENMGAEIVKEVAGRANETAGDGTSTAITVLDSLVDEGMQSLSAGSNPLAVRTGMEKAVNRAVELLKEMARPIKGTADVEMVATISSESPELGRIIAAAIEEVGKDGAVTVEESHGTELSCEVVKGMQIDSGYASPYLVTDPERMEAEIKGVSILLTDRKINSVQEVLPLFEKIAKAGKKELVVIADDVSADVLATFVMNKLRGSFTVLVIKNPGYGDRKRDVLDDLAVITGATVISAESGLTLEEAALTHLGVAGRVTATKNSSLFVEGKGTQEDIDARVVQLQSKRKEASLNYEKDSLDTRIAKFTGGVAVIRVGAATETEMHYLKDKLDDAVKAARASLEEGIVPGGGVALAKVAYMLTSELPIFANEDERTGYKIVTRALGAPFLQILANAGVDTADLDIMRIQETEGFSGYDAALGVEVDDMIVAGIIDPVKVTRSAIQNALSAAAIFLTTEAAIVDVTDDKTD